MATFEVKVVKIDSVEEHPNADRLTLVKIGGYTCIANKLEDGSWRYQPGDHVAYIPANALMPEWILRKLGMWKEEKGVGILAGKKGNRVKPLKLRGIFSEGIMFPLTHHGIDPDYIYTLEFETEVGTMTTGVVEGEDIADKLGITKYEPVIPSQMDGQVFGLGEKPCHFDLEPIEKHMDMFNDMEAVIITEKLHGTFTGFSIINGLNHPEAFRTAYGDRNVVVYSKGLGAKQLMFSDNTQNASNLYVQQWTALSERDGFWDWFDEMTDDQEWHSIHILGETYGKGVQDLSYGEATQKQFRIFAIGSTATAGGETLWACFDSVESHAQKMGSQTVPVLYRGPYHYDVVVEHRDGQTTLGGDHIREGVVVYTAAGRYEPGFGAVKLKAVSPDYKLRKGGTEFN